MHRSGGFSLIEVLCAVLILGVGLVGVMEGITLSLKSSKIAHHHTTAALLAAGRIETLRAESYIYEGDEEGDFGDAMPQYTWSQSIEETDQDGLYDVVVEIKSRTTDTPIYTLRTRLFDMPLDALYDANTTSTEPLPTDPRDPRNSTGRRPLPMRGRQR